MLKTKLNKIYTQYLKTIILFIITNSFQIFYNPKLQIISYLNTNKISFDL